MSRKAITTALSAIIATGISSQSIATETQMDMSNFKIPKGMEQCYGIAKAGQNDCGSNTLSCAGSSKIDSDKDAWIMISKGTCNKIVGGNLKPSSK